MNRCGADLGPGRDHPWAAPAATMTERSAMRVPDGGGGRRCGRHRREGLTQRDELQGRIHGPAHQLSERALVLATGGHRREHVFSGLRSRSDGKTRSERDPHGPIRGSRGAEPKAPRRGATDLAWRPWAAATGGSLPALRPFLELELVRLAADRLGE